MAEKGTRKRGNNTKIYCRKCTNRNIRAYEKKVEEEKKRNANMSIGISPSMNYRTRLDDEVRLEARFFRYSTPFDCSVTFVELANLS